MSRIRRGRSNIVFNDETRLFVQNINKSPCDKSFDYHSCIVLADVTLSKSDNEKHYYPSPLKYDEFLVLAALPGLPNPGTSGLETNFTTENSVLGKYFKTKCTFDMQVHMGKCATKPSDFSTFDKALIFKDVVVDGYTVRNVMTATQGDRNPVTESLDFTFEKMYEVTKPNFILYESDVVGAGPILESFTFCNDSRCDLCVGTTGKYFVQILECGEECHTARVIYTLDNGDTWRVKHLNLCDDILCEQNVNSNIIIDANLGNIAYVHLNPSLGNSINQIVNNSIDYFATSVLLGGEILKGFTKYNTTFYLGTNGRLLISNYDGRNRLINNVFDISRNLLSIHSLDGENFVIGSENGRVYVGNIDNEVQSMVIPNGGNIHAIEMISDCSFIAATGESGGILMQNGVPTRVKGIRGAITKFAFFNEDIGYATSVNGTTNYIWQTVDGGKNWQALDTTLPSTYVITTLTICDFDHNVISIAGRKMSSPVSIADMLDPLLKWDCLGTGFVLLSK
jgi:hypothetical protein